MKRYFNLFAPVAVAAIVLLSCEVEINPSVHSNALKITVKANAQELATDSPETKTYIDGYTIRWGTGEYMKLAVTAGETTIFANSTDASSDAFDGDAEALFEFSVSPASAASYLYQGIYPASAAATNSNTNPLNYKVNLPTTQNASATSYDPAAYIMVAKPETFNSVQTDWEAYFRRATALNRITLKNVPDGKLINKVKISAPGKKLAGGRHFNLSTGESTDIYGNEAAIDVKFASALSGANVDVWFTSWGVDLIAGETLEIVAYTTDKKSYTKTIALTGEQKISFKEGYLNTLGANMSGIAPEDVTELEEGNYLVLAKNGTNYYALKAEKDAGGQRLLSVDYTGSLDSYLGDADLIWSISKSGDSYIFENNSKYLGYKGSSNESYWLEADAEWTEANYLLDVTVHELPTYYVTLNTDDSRYLSKNNPGSFFAFYGNTAQYADIVFVPASVDPRTVVTLSFDEDAVGYTTANYGSFLGQGVTVSPNVLAVTDHLSWSKDDEDSVIDDFDDGVLTLTGNEGTATVTVSFAGDANYRPALASYTIIVSPSSGPRYELVSSLGDITPGEYIIVNNGKYLPNTETSSSPLQQAVTISKGVVQNVTSAMTWTFIGDTDEMTIKSTADGTPYLYCTNSNTGLRVGNTSDTWIIDVNGDGFSLCDTNHSRYCATYASGSDWRSYGSADHANYGDGGQVYLYKYDDPRPEAPISWNAASGTATWTSSGITSTLPDLVNSKSLEVSYTSSNKGVATVNSSGVVTIVGGGSTKISATFVAVPASSYKTTIVSYTLTVTDSRPTCATPTFSPAAGAVVAGTKVTISCGTAGASIYYTVDGSTPTTSSTLYSSAITVDAAKTIKAIAVKENYINSAVATSAYTISGGTTEVSVTISDYASSNKWVNGTKYTSVTIDSNITATADGTTNTGKYYSSGNDWRFYQNESATLTISASGGKTIKDVKVTYSVSNSGVLKNGASSITSGSKVTVNSSSITFEVGNSGSATNGQVRVTKIEVAYQ